MKTLRLHAPPLALAVVFALAGALKLANPSDFARSIEAYRLVPPIDAALLATYLPWLELSLAAGLAFTAWRRAAAGLGLVLIAIFTAAVGSAWIRGIDLDCGCFGHGAGTTPAAAFVRDLALLALAVWTFLHATPVAAPARPGDPPASPHQRRRLILAGILVALVVAVAWIFHTLPDGTWKRMVNGLPLWELLTALVFLPLVGFPVSVLYVAVGARFGIAVGLVYTGLATVAHLCLSYLIGRHARRPLLAIIEWTGWSLPDIHPSGARPFALWLALVPGLSYSLKNYMPALVGLPFRASFTCYLPVHLMTAIIGLALGGATMKFSWTLVAAVAVYAGFMTWLTRRLARRLKSGAAAHPSSAAKADPR